MSATAVLATLSQLHAKLALLAQGQFPTVAHTSYAANVFAVVSQPVNANARAVAQYAATVFAVVRLATRQRARGDGDGGRSVRGCLDWLVGYREQGQWDYRAVDGAIREKEEKREMKRHVVNVCA